jgi:spoIIIJ-associated protein
MSSFVEIEGKNVEQAIKNACEKLKISEENIKHEILSYGSSGIFGLVGAKKAKIRVMVPDPDPPPEMKSHKVAISQPSPKWDAVSEDAVNEDNPFLNDPNGINNTEIADFGKSVLENILRFISPETIVLYKIEKNRIYYKIDGGEPGVLIGKRGQTLDAIQYILEKIINKKHLEKVRVQVDIEGYVENRNDNLQALAEKLAEKAKKTGKPVTVGNMSALDRRIVHLTLKKDDKVRTKSIGDGFVRKLIIFPKGGSKVKKNDE